MVNLIYIAVGVLALAAVVLGVLNLMTLSRIGAAINSIEQEIEKKALEFDAIRKDRLSGLSNAPSSMEEHITESAITSGSAGGYGDSGQIQVFRNVRTIQFDGNPVPSGISTESAGSSQQFGAVSSGVLPQPAPVNTPDNQNQMAGAGEGASSMAQEHGQPQIIPVFSPRNRYADYAAVGEMLQHAIQTTRSLLIVLDFNCVSQISHPELTYLRQVVAYVQSCGRSVILINCQGALYPVFQNDSLLGSLLKG